MKNARRHLVFVFIALICVHLPLLAMHLVRAGPVAYILFYYPPFTLVPGAAVGLGAWAGTDVKKYWYVPLLVPLAYLLSLYGAFRPFRWMGAYLLLGVAAMALCHFIRKFIG